VPDGKTPPAFSRILNCCLDMLTYLIRLSSPLPPPTQRRWQRRTAAEADHGLRHLAKTYVASINVEPVGKGSNPS